MFFLNSFRQGQMYRYEMGKYDVDSIISFASHWYKNVKSERVPRELTWFDQVTDDIVIQLKVIFNSRYILETISIF